MSPRGRLFRKYVVVFAGLVSGALLASGAIELYFSYGENKAALVQIQREKALGAAARIEQFVHEIERQIGWTTHPVLATGAAALEQRRVDYFRLLRQVPAVTEISQLDASGREQLRVSRLAMDVVGSQADFSKDPRFLEASAGKTYFSPVYFRKESEPYITVGMASGGGAIGVTVAEVNLKFIWDVVSQIKIGRAGYAYVVDGRGQLIAHPDISLVLKKTDLSSLPQVRLAIAPAPAPAQPRPETGIARNLQGRQVLANRASIAPLGWAVLIEQPLEEAFEPLRASIQRTLLLLLGGIALSVLAGLVLARKMVTPIRALQAGAARIGGGALDQRIEVRTGDELEALAEQFNRMASQLEESYASLEHKVEERTRELTEALEQQTATAEILRVISSSPTDIQPVLDAVATSAARFCAAENAVIFRTEGDVLRAAASFGPMPPNLTTPLSRGGPAGRAVIDRQTVHVHDLAAEIDTEFPDVREAQKCSGLRSVLTTPLLREGVAIGAIALRRMEVRPFTDKQIELVKTFADQAVIAIENVRLFTELQDRNRQITEALEQQTATAEILGVISSSPTDLQPVFDAILDKATRLCDAHLGALGLYDGERYQHVTGRGATPQFREWLLGGPRSYDPGTGIGRMIRELRPIHIADLAQEPAYKERNPARVATVELGGARTFLAVPMIKEGRLVGGIAIYRPEVRPFTDKQIELVSMFASQAVIAIENVRLFQELQARTQELSRSLEEVRALSEVSQAVSASLDLRRVLDAVVSHAVRLSNSDACGIFEVAAGRERYEVVASHNLSAEYLEVIRTTPVDPRRSVIRRATERGEAIQVPDLAVAQEVHARESGLREGFRALLTVPMGFGDVTRGLILFRRTPGSFDDRVVTLLTALANQSKIAIENARLFQEIEDKSRQLEVANRHKSEFLANMSHELRTPLNAIIGFSEVLVERMFGELNEKQDEYLRDIFSSGRHLLSLINDILDLSKIEAGRMELELATFDLPQAVENALTLVRGRADAHAIVLDVAVDERLGEFSGDERKFKQILLNLLSNAVKFTPDGGRVGVKATLANGSVEVAVSDTGIGIPQHEQELIFEEFRQAGVDHVGKREGTGLGLTLTKKFVELHGGAIWVKSEVGRGSTFTFTLPVRPWPTS